MPAGTQPWPPFGLAGPLSSPSEWWAQMAATGLPLALQTFQALLIAAAAVFVGRRVRDLIRRSLKRTLADPAVVLLLGQLGYFAVLGVGAIWILAIYNVPPAGLVAALGAAGLAVTLALQDVLKNLVAGLYLLVEKPFRPGDTLTVRTFDGVVESVDVRITTLRTAAGDRVLIPNAVLFAEVLVNRGVPAAPPAVDAAAPAGAPGAAGGAKPV